VAKRKQNKLHKLAIERIERYWTCSECAKAKGWIPPSWPVTCISGLCGWCDRDDEVTLTPIVDFKRGSKDAVWD
jgi:hypothetical protein